MEFAVKLKNRHCEEPISPEFRLSLCLYRQGRGDYFYTISELGGLAPCTVSTIVNEVNEAIISCLWKYVLLLICQQQMMPLNRKC